MFVGTGVFTLHMRSNTSTPLTPNEHNMNTDTATDLIYNPFPSPKHQKSFAFSMEKLSKSQAI